MFQGEALLSPESERDLSDGDFSRFATLIHEACGIALTEQKRELLKARLRKRLRATGEPGYQAYYRRVSEDSSGLELKELLDAITTNKTEFFRESRHFDHLRDTVIPAWLAARAGGDKPFRVWSAACSSGEEVYTLAMTLDQALAGKAPFKVLGTDISGRVLARASEGVYEPRHLESVPEKLIETYFTPAPGGRWAVGPALRQRVAFGRVNLTQPPWPMREPFDVIFCRNVMIYFNRVTQEKLVDDLTGLLKPGGYLYTGLSESLLAIKHALKTAGPSIYVKP